MAGDRLDSQERIARIVGIQREIAAAGTDLQVVMQLVAERSQEITSADGAMVNLLDGDTLHARAASGIAASAPGARRPLSDSVAKYAIESGQPILIEDTLSDPRINAFIPVAQETALIGPLTLYVIDEALRQTREWQDAGIGLSVSVNIGMRNLLDVEFPGQVARLLERRQVNAELLELEITESTMLTNPSRTEAVLEELSSLGVKLSIDDFGTAHSSFGYMRRVPISEIKIDRSIIKGMEEEGPDMAVVRSAIDIGRNLGIKVVAEGVETQEVWTRLRELGCGEAQGYYLSRPVPPEQLREWLAGRPPQRGEAT